MNCRSDEFQHLDFPLRNPYGQNVQGKVSLRVIAGHGPQALRIHILGASCMYYFRRQHA